MPPWLPRLRPVRGKHGSQELCRGEAQHGSLWGGGLQPLGGIQAPTLNPLLARSPEPVGSCLYLVTLGGFASSTGIWHQRWKISLVGSPWKQAEPLRRFTLNGAHPACIRCPVCLEFPPKLLDPLGRPGASPPAKGLGPLPLQWMQAALRWACPALWTPDPSPCALRLPGSRPPPPLPPDLVSPGAGRGAPNGLSASGRWRGWEPPAGVASRPRPSSCPPCPFPQTAALRGGGLVPVPAAPGATG